ncbi:MAG: hypothetical protein QOH28_532 [Actinomycetota bacterium]|jgi:anti-sigma regulatory factor (Ser/Thr protein kinase)|nr:hypothetical protein [Actinomycetota bacterium]
MSVLLEDGPVHEPEHVVGFYDGDDDLVGAVAAFLAEGLHRDGASIVVATADHRVALERALTGMGFATDSLVSDGRYRSFDAGETLAVFMRDDRPDPQAFGAALGPLIVDAARGGGPVRIFGEMVALLWEEGNVAAAIDLESLWNGLADEHPFTLYCAYPTAILQDGDLAAAKQVCDRHSGVVSLSGDLGTRTTFAVSDGQDGFARGFVPTPTVLHAVRTFVADVLRAWGADELVDDALVVANELATNAWLHARSPFRLSITRTSAVLEIAVRDASAAWPEQRPRDPNRVGGRGIALIDSIARRWGTRDEPDGKTVWVELVAT